MFKRIAVASLMQEGNTFAPQKTTLTDFERYYVWRGGEIIERTAAMRNEVAGFMSVLAAANMQPVPLVAAYAAAGGVVTRDAFEAILTDIEDRLRQAGPIDGLLLALHGALVVEGQPDGDGEVILRIRKILPEGTPIGVSLDLHGHITPLMLQPDTFHVGYRTFPHIDMFETGERTARLIVEAVTTGRIPKMALAKRHMLISPTCTRTTDGPFVPFVEKARALETGSVKAVSYFCVQPWLDVPDLGFAGLVAADNEAAAQEAADALADAVWGAREQFFPELYEIDEVIRVGFGSQGLTVVSDAGDAPTGGAAGDSAAVLSALLRCGADRAGRLSYLTLCDPAAAAAAHAAGLGKTVKLQVGHSFTPELGTPVTIEGVVTHLSDGNFRMADGGFDGMLVAMGDTAVISIGDIRLNLRSAPAMEWDRAMYTSQGLALEDAALVFAKSPSHFRHSFGPFAARILVANTPGVTVADMRRIPFTQVTRPLYPQDPI